MSCSYCLTSVTLTAVALRHECDILHWMGPCGSIVGGDNHRGELLPYFDSTVQELLIVVGSIGVRPCQAPCPV